MAEAYTGPTRLMIGGEWVDGVKGQTIDVLNPFNATKITAIAEATEEDVDRAVAAAKAAFPAWAKMAAHDRGALMLKLADAIEARAEEFIALEALDTGHPVMDARRLDVPRTVLCFRYFGGMADKLQGDVLPVDRGLPELRQARADRRGRPDRAVELPADVHQLEARPGAGGGQHGGDEAGRADAAVDVADRRAGA